MNLTQLALENFGKFKNFECRFTDGLNVIKGANETGKSTLVSAITSLLYEDPAAPHEKTEDFKTWGAHKASILKAGIASKSFTGILEKDFDRGRTRLDNSALNVTIDDKSRIFEVITGAVGFPSAELFEATSCIKQGEITQIGRSVEAIKNKLEAMVTGGKEDLAASRIAGKIDRRIEEISRNDQHRPGLIQALEQKQSSLNYNIDKISRDINNLKTWRNALAQVEIAYANGMEDYQAKKQKLGNALKVEVAGNKSKQLDDRIKEIASQVSRSKEAGERVQFVNQKLKQAVSIPQESRNQIEELESILKYLRPKQKDLENELEAERGKYEKFKISGGISVLTFLGLGSLVFAVADYFLQLTVYFIHAGAAGLALILLALFLFSKGTQTRSFLKNQLADKQKKAAEVKADIEKANGELKQALAKFNIVSADQVRQLAWKRSELENQLTAEKETCIKYLAGSTQQELEIQLQNLEKELVGLKSEQQGGEKLDPAEIERLKLITAQLEEQKNTLEHETRNLQRQIETTEGGAELLASYLERQEEVATEKIRLVEELAILSLTKECVEKARQNVMISTLDLLEKRTSEILDLISDGKYNKVRFDRASLNFEVFSQEKNDWANPRKELSQTTIEQIYLTARLSLTEILGDEARPPIILDDPFESFDAKRRENSIKLLKQMARDRQIFLLTSGDAYDAWADNTIQL